MAERLGKGISSGMEECGEISIETLGRRASICLQAELFELELHKVADRLG
jgi:hypothetical protein